MGGKRSRQLYEVECIMRAIYKRRAKQWNYEVKWKGYPDSENSLETERSFKTCEALLERFWAEIGLDLRLEPFKPGTKTYKDRIVGTTGNGTVTPSPQWIEAELRRFRETYEMPQPTVVPKTLPTTEMTSTSYDLGDVQGRSDAPPPSATKKRRLDAAISYSSNDDFLSPVSEKHPAEQALIEQQCNPSVLFRGSDQSREPAVDHDGEWAVGMDSGADEDIAVSHTERAPSQPPADDGAGDRMAQGRSLTSRRSPLFTPAPEERTISPPRTQSPIGHVRMPSALDQTVEPLQASSIAVHGSILFLPLAGTYSSGNAARNKVAQRCGLSVVPAQHNPTREVAAEAPVPEEGSFMLEHNVDVRGSSLKTKVDDASARFSDDPKRSAQVEDTAQNFTATTEWGSASTSDWSDLSAHWQPASRTSAAHAASQVAQEPASSRPPRIPALNALPTVDGHDNIDCQDELAYPDDFHEVSDSTSAAGFSPTLSPGATRTGWDLHHQTPPIQAVESLPAAWAVPDDLKRTSTSVWRGSLSIKVAKFVIILADIICTTSAPESDFDLVNQLSARPTLLHLDKFHTWRETGHLVALAGTVAQRATISPASTEDEEGLQVFTDFLRSTSQSVVLPYVGQEGEWIGHTVVYPTSRKVVGTSFGTPADGCKHGLLAVKVVPLGGVLAGTPMVLSTKGNLSGTDKPPPSDKCSFVAYAAKLLAFDDDLLNLLRNATSGLRYHLVDAPVALGIHRLQPSGLIRFVLDCFGAVETRAQAARLLFVPRHIPSHLDHLPLGLPAMLRRPEVRVYSYEASTRRCKDVALQESFMTGGILTATPMALVSDLASSTKLLKQAADHPLWSSYVLPFVLGMALTLYYDGQDPLKAYKSNPQAFVFRSLLEAIVDRRCHLVAPPATPLNAPLSLAFPHSVEHVIRIALHDFQSTFGGMSKELWETKAKALLEQDVNSWRTNSEHVRIRHACILVHPRDPALSDSTRTKIEWLPPSGKFVCDGFWDEEETL